MERVVSHALYEKRQFLTKTRILFFIKPQKLQDRRYGYYLLPQKHISEVCRLDQ